jgi:hypothetical protein
MREMTLKHNKTTQRFLKEHHDRCTVCDRAFKNNDTTHLGYNSSRKIVNVGNCCSVVLSETIIRHSFRERAYEIPADNIILWRFMDFTKFVSLLKENALFFTRADKFEDPFEGAKGLLKNKPKWDKFYTDFSIEAIRTIPGGANRNKTDKELLKDAVRLLNDINGIGKRQLESTFINCWHENQYESEAMWKLYTVALNQGIAIKTAYKRLYQSLGREPGISIGRVNYMDYEKGFASINDSFWFKRKSFEHEREVRAVISAFKAEDVPGKLVPVNLNQLIEKIYLSPTSQTWFKQLVEDVLGKYGLRKKIFISDMMAKPFH